MTTRPIKEIAGEIARTWKKVHYGARPYLEAMLHLESITDTYGWDSGRSIVTYFLANAGSFRGENARRIKAELRAML